MTEKKFSLMAFVKALLGGDDGDNNGDDVRVQQCPGGIISVLWHTKGSSFLNYSNSKMNTIYFTAPAMPSSLGWQLKRKTH